MALLEGKKVYLRLIEKEDLNKRVKWINDSSIQKTLNFDYPTSYSKTKKWFDKVVMDMTRRDFSIFSNMENEYIGFCGFLNIKKPVMKAEIYLTIGDKDYQKGIYAMESFKLLMEYGFIELGLNKIYGYQLKENKAAFKILELLGWKREGLLRKDIYSHGRIADRYITSILREEWEGNKR